MGAVCFDDLPDDVLTDGILFHLDSTSVDALGQVSRRCDVLTKDEAFWRKKIRLDFGLSFDLFDVDRVSFGFARNLWKGLKNPKVYVWGSTENHRSGIPQSSPHLMTYRTPPSVPYPVEITSVFKASPPKRGVTDEETTGSNAGLVELKSGGFSFIARDSEGNVWVWGQLDASFFGGQWDFASASKRVVTPTRLGMPVKVKQISIGRRHILLLGDDNAVWEMRSYGRAYRHTATQLGNPDVASSIVTQAEAGWNWSICLTESGRIYAWWPFLATYEATLTVEEGLEGPLQGNDEDDFQAYSESSSIPVRWGEVGADVPFELPTIPMLSEEDSFGTGRQCWGEDLVISRHPLIEDYNCVTAVGAGDSFCVALKANGEVWSYELKESENPISKTWRYLSQLSGPDVRHVSASFNSITSYSTTKAFSIKSSELSKENPHITAINSPSGLPVRKVVMGDYHTVACDHAGAAFAWGENTAGQLGRGEIGSRNVGDLAQPTTINFGRGDEKANKGRASQRYLGQFPDRCQRTDTGDFKPDFRTRRFVFDVAAGGWQSGALVVDMRDYCVVGNRLQDESSSHEDPSTRGDTENHRSTAQEACDDSQSRTDRHFSSQPADPGLEASHPTSERASTQDDQASRTRGVSAEASILQHGQCIPIRRGGLPHIRIGFAGRGGRGGPGFANSRNP